MKTTMTDTAGSRRRGGMITVWMTVTMVAWFGIFGLALDTAYVFLVQHQMQNAADAAALAGAGYLQNGSASAISEAKTAGGANTAGGSSDNVVINTSDVVLGNYNLSSATFSANTTPYNAVQVTAHQTSASPSGATTNLIFAPMFSALYSALEGQKSSLTTSYISGTAIAMTELYAGVIVLDPSAADALKLTGTGTLDVPGGVVQVNSTSASATYMSGSAAMTATELRIDGGLSKGGGVTTVPTTVTGATPVADPLASLAEPSVGADLGSFNETKGDTTYSLGPGYYSGGITLGGNNTLNLSAGVYIIGGGTKKNPGGLNISNSATLNAPGVMFYFTGSGSYWGTLDLSGNPVVNLSPPTSGTYAGISFFQDRDTPSSTAAQIANSSTMTLPGTMYLPSIQLDVSGSVAQTIANQLIVDTLVISGSGAVTIDYDNRNPVDAPSNKVFLVQ